MAPARPNPVGRCDLVELGERASIRRLWGPGVGTHRCFAVVRFGEHHNMQCGGQQALQDVVVWSWYRIPDAQ